MEYEVDIEFNKYDNMVKRVIADNPADALHGLINEHCIDSWEINYVTITKIRDQ